MIVDYASREGLSDIRVEVDDHLVKVAYLPERIPFTSREEALRFVEMLCDGRVELEIEHGLLWTTMRSYRDGRWRCGSLWWRLLG